MTTSHRASALAGLPSYGAASAPAIANGATWEVDVTRFDIRSVTSPA